jgi:hypothetical protein
MILALLLQVLLFEGYTAEATSVMRIPMPQVEAVPVTYGRARYMAWVRTCYGPCVQKVFIARDVADLGPPQTLRYLAYHESCHLREGHYLWPTPDPKVAHLQVESCMDRSLGVAQHRELRTWYDLFSATLRRMRVLRFGPLSQE